MEPKESAANPLKSESCAKDMIQLEPQAIPGGLASANALPPTSPQHGQGSSTDRGASLLHCYYRTKPKELYAVSLKGNSCGDDMIQRVAPGSPEGLESAKGQPPAYPRQFESNAGDRTAHQISTGSSAAEGSILLKSTVDHEQAYDSSTFPTSCTLRKNDKGRYILSGACSLCCQTFRAAGCVCKNKVRPRKSHSGVRQEIIQHAQMHDAVDYMPQPDLNAMNLHWTRSQDMTSTGTPISSQRLPPEETSTGTPISSQHVPQDASALHCYYNASDLRNRSVSAFCVGCASWKRTTEFRRGASTCNACLQIPCSACGRKKQQHLYRTGDVYNFLNKKITLAVKDVANWDGGSEDRNTSSTKENIAVSAVALDVEYTRARQPFGELKEGA